MIKSGTWVEIMQVVLTPEERSSAIPKETRETPLKMWAKGFLLKDADLGEVSKIKTVNGRKLEGIITEVNPRFDHDFGDFVPEIMYIGPQAKSILWGEDYE